MTDGWKSLPIPGNIIPYITRTDVSAWARARGDILRAVDPAAETVMFRMRNRMDTRKVKTTFIRHHERGDDRHEPPYAKISEDDDGW